MGLILDTSILIAAERRKFDLLAFYAANADEELRISAVTSSELLHGVERAETPARKLARSKRVEGYLLHFVSIEFDLAIARTHAALWAHLQKKGRLIGAHDLMIAATASHYGHGLATLNRAEFAQVPHLRLVKTEPFILK